MDLDVLLVLVADPGRWWSGADLGDALRASPDEVARILEGLAAGNLLDIKVGNDVLYRFSPLDDVDPVIREIDTLRRIDRQAVDRMLENDR